MTSTRRQLRPGFLIWLVSAAALRPSVSAWGQTALAGETPAVKPDITVERQGRLLVLSYRLVGADDQPLAQSVPSGRPEFTVHKGKRKIASGQFEYG